MRKLLKVLLGLALAAAGGLAVFVATYEPAQRPAPAETVEATPARVARGEYLVHHVVDCFGCHSRHDWSRYAGPVQGQPGIGGECLTAEQGAPGRICVPNITPDPETGIGSWTDGEILRAMREGVDREGEALFPMMPYLEYRRLSDEDARAVVAYLRSVPGVRNPTPETRLDFPVSFFIKMAPKPLDGPVPEPARSGPAYGEYLATIAGCRFCHTPVDERMQPVPGRLLAGGHEHRGPWGVVLASNLTPHATGLGNRSKAEFIALFRSFADASAVAVPVRDGRNTVMPWYAYAGMTDDDLGAIYDYLRTLPPVENRVIKWRPAAMASR